MKSMILICIGLCLIAGCISSTVTDSNGVTKKVVSLDPNNAIVVNADTGLTVGQMIAAASGTIWPIGTLMAGALGAALAAWRKYKPLLTAATTQATQSYNTTSAVVSAIETYKTDNPTEWLKLEEYLTKAIGPNAENVIRAIRGLPPKE
jgi:hypothetical protein